MRTALSAPRIWIGNANWFGGKRRPMDVTNRQFGVSLVSGIWQKGRYTERGEGDKETGGAWMLRRLGASGLIIVLALAATGCARGAGTPSVGRASASSASTSIASVAASSTTTPTGASSAIQATIGAFASSNSSPVLDTIDAVNAGSVWVGGNGLILATTDGGKSWNAQYRGTVDVTALDFVNTDIGWALGKTHLLMTTDGGRTWTPASEPADHLTGVEFLGASNGYGYASTKSGTRLFHSSDGGQVWSSVMTPTPVRTFAATSSTVGWMLGTNGAIYQTINAGASWTLRYDGTPGMYLLASVNSQIAWAASKDGATVMRTTDGGVDWAPAGNPILASTSSIAGGGILRAIVPVDAQTAWGVLSTATPAAGGFQEVIVRTTDGGESWHVAGTGENIAALHVINGEAAFAMMQLNAVAQTEIAVTADGGVQWTSQRLSINGLDAAFTDTLNGWLVGTQGGQGIVERTSDGGHSWYVVYKG